MGPPSPGTCGSGRVSLSRNQSLGFTFCCVASYHSRYKYRVSTAKGGGSDRVLGGQSKEEGKPSGRTWER